MLENETLEKLFGSSWPTFTQVKSTVSPASLKPDHLRVTLTVFFLTEQSTKEFASFLLQNGWGIGPGLVVRGRKFLGNVSSPNTGEHETLCADLISLVRSYGEFTGIVACNSKHVYAEAWDE